MNYPMKYLLAVTLAVAALSVFSHPKKIKSYAEKKEIAEDMKKIAKALGVKCSYCHTEAERGLRAGDFTLLTRKGNFAHDQMFPLSEKFKVDCSFCHNGYEKFTAAGERAAEDADYIKNYNKSAVKKINCESCHQPPVHAAEQPFKTLTKFGKRPR